MYNWTPNTANSVEFVMVDANGDEVAGLGDVFSVELAPSGTPLFAAGLGTQGEIGSGWYYYEATTGECPASGQVAIRVTAVGCAQQNLVAQVTQSVTGSGAISHEITIDDGTDPIDGAEVWISTDLAGNNVVAGTLSTDALGNVTFLLDAGNYYAWVQASGFNFTNPTAFTVA
jgi:hypothetical protein